MKSTIHPKSYKTAVTCACGNTFETISTKEKIVTEICSNCHPFFTGKQNLVDTAHRVEKYQEKKKKQAEIGATKKHLTKKTKQAARQEKKQGQVKAAKADAKAALKAAKSALSAH